MFSRDLTLARFDADLFAAMEQEAQRCHHAEGHHDQAHQPLPGAAVELDEGRSIQ